VLWREKLNKVSAWYRLALAQVQKILNEYDSMSRADGDFALTERAE
jgi:hypothetical protein